MDPKSWINIKYVFWIMFYYVYAIKLKKTCLNKRKSINVSGLNKNG